MYAEENTFLSTEFIACLHKAVQHSQIFALDSHVKIIFILLDEKNFRFGSAWAAYELTTS